VTVTSVVAISLPAPLVAVDFTLPATDGTPFAFRERTADNTLTLLFFGYTSCPDICPVHMANLAAVLRRLPPQVAGGVGVVMVTVDPERDTPERLRDWLDNFDRSFVGLTGTTDEVNAVMQSLRLPPAVLDPPGEDGSYLVGHAAQVLVVTADGLLRAMYPSGTRQVDWAHDLPLLVRADWGPQ